MGWHLKILLTIVILIVGKRIWAETEVVDGVTWSFTLNGEEVTITKASPSEGDLFVPSTLGERPVTGIGDSAFQSCSKVTSVTLPMGLTSIGRNAFYDCYGLLNVFIPSTVTNVGVAAFLRCSNLRAIDLPPNLLEINGYVFYQCEKLQAVEIPPGVRSIGDQAFLYCKGLTSVIVPSSVTNIGRSAFLSCTNLTSVTLSPNIRSINRGTFESCSRLMEVVVPFGVTTIEERAFYGCTRLEVLSLPLSVTRIEGSAFYDCTGLKVLSLPLSITRIGENAFRNCKGLRKITIPECVARQSVLGVFGQEIVEAEVCDGVTRIGPNAFFGLNKMESVIIPSSVTNVPDTAFNSCTSIRNITIPQCVTSVNSCFHDSYGSITNVVFCEGVTNIPAFVLGACYDLVRVTIPSSVKNIGHDSFASCNRLKNVIFKQPSSVTNIGECAFHACRELEEIKIPTGVRSIGLGAFMGCKNLQSVLLPWGVVSIGQDAFSGCSKLKGISIPLSVNEIGDSTFYGCNSLANISIPPSVSRIGSNTFVDCTSLRDAVIPSEVAYIGANAFDGCSASLRVSFEGCPPAGFADAGLSSLAIIRYNVAYSSEWAPVLAKGKFETTQSYVPTPIRPVFVPESGTTFEDTLSVSIISSSGATIYYTLDGSVPTVHSTQYVKKFRIGKKTTVRAVAVYENGMSSELAAAEYAKGTCAKPVISPVDGTTFYHSHQPVTIEWPGTDGVLRYTLDGSDPTEASTEYTSVFTVSGTTTVKAKVFSDTHFDSQVESANLTREWLTVATPMVSVEATFVGPTNPVSVTCATEGASIFYTLDGSEPTDTSNLYTGPFNVTNSCVVKVKAICPDYLDSSVMTSSIVRNWQSVETPVVNAQAVFTGSRTEVSVSCATDGALIYYTTDGSAPSVKSSAYEGVFYVTNTCCVRALSVLSNEVYRGSAETSFSIQKEWTIGDTLNAPDQQFSVAGDLGWVRDVTVSHDGAESMRSGAIGDYQRSELSTTVYGSGLLSFWLKVSCEDSDGYYDYDRLEFTVDGKVYCFDGVRAWTNVILRLSGNIAHSLRWAYVKDNAEKAAEDCVWIDEFSFKDLTADPIPDLSENLSATTVGAVFADAADLGIRANIDESNYNDFRDWAGKVKAQGGNAAGAQGVMSADNAWLSYALGQGTLLESAPTDEDLSVEAFEPAAEAGKFDFTVSVAGVEVGSEAAKENLKKVFGLEGAVTLEGAAFSSDKVDIEFSTPVDGKVKFAAGPRDTSAGVFFMKVKMLP